MTGYARLAPAALLLLPLHRRMNELVGRLVDRDRLVISGRVRQFVRDVRDGTAEPEQIADLLREVLADPGLRLLVRLPGDATGYVDLTGAPAHRRSARQTARTFPCTPARRRSARSV